MEVAHSPTNIDRTKCKRRVPMRCLVLGLGRTGTKSICKALEKLGFDHVYHMDSALNNPPDNDLWIRALAAKYPVQGGTPTTFARQEWDQLLGHCQAVTDFPAVLFARELIETYPEAKVILTLRDVDLWYRSVLRTIDWRYHDPGLYITSLISPTASKYAAMFYQMWFYFSRGDFRKYGKQAFIEHYEMVRSLITQERLLEYDVRDGWEPLCKFLDLELPCDPFPSGNDTDDFKTLVRRLDGIRIREAAQQHFYMLAAVAVAAVTVVLFAFLE